MQKTTFLIEGNRRFNNPRIWVDAVELDPSASKEIFNHSPDGFNWGYGGSGPAQTALAICLAIFPEQWQAVAVYQAFKWAFVCHWKLDVFAIEIDIANFLLDNRELLQDDNRQGG